MCTRGHKSTNALKEVELLYHQKVEFQIDHLVHRSKQSAKEKASVSLVKTKRMSYQTMK